MTTCPAFFSKKRETTYRIVRVISRLFYCLVIYPLSRHAGRIDISHVNSNKEQSVFWKRKVHFLNNINEPGIAE
jgi:hypothetical protein